MASQAATHWDAGLCRSFRVGTRTVWISLGAMRQDDGRARFLVTWSPDRPTRLTAEDFEQFEAGCRVAQSLILAHLATKQ